MDIVFYRIRDVIELPDVLWALGDQRECWSISNVGKVMVSTKTHVNGRVDRRA